MAVMVVAAWVMVVVVHGDFLSFATHINDARWEQPPT
jgi:hypothetical protein